jgi:uncharacterized iron-regulated protein
MSGKLKNKIALVTGGNSGIGLATAQRFVAEGAQVFITGRRQAELDAAVKQIGENAVSVQGDVSKLTDLDRLRQTRSAVIFATIVSMLCFCVFPLLQNFSQAQTVAPRPDPPLKSGHFYAGTDHRELSWEAVLHTVAPGTIIVLGEEHEHGPIANQQNALIAKLIQYVATHPTLQQSRIHLGLELLSDIDQAVIDAFVDQTLPETEFLQSLSDTHWSAQGFALYRRQIAQIAQAGGHVIGLNLSRTLIRNVAVEGVNHHVQTIAKQYPLPATLLWGNPVFVNLLLQAMTAVHPLPPEQLANYVMAQFIKDEVMAHNLLAHKHTRPQDIYVVIAGIYHVAYFGGLVDRLVSRQETNLVTIAQTVLFDDHNQVRWDHLFPLLSPFPRVVQKHEATAGKFIEGALLPAAHIIWPVSDCVTMAENRPCNNAGGEG